MLSAALPWLPLEAAALLTLEYEPAQVAVKVFPRCRAGTN
jgi:hypothetical protein